jgi:hypothetical protein
MTSFPGAPALLKGGIVLVDAQTAAVQRVIPLQYNPESLTRSLEPQMVQPEGGDRAELLRFKGPPNETITIEAEIDATDQLERPDRFPDVVQVGIYAKLAALETSVSASSTALISNNLLAAAGGLEILPIEGPLTLFVWSRRRVLPVRITQFSVTEDAFDPSLNPLRAKVNLTMRVLSVNDLPFAHKGSSLFLAYLQQKEQLVAGQTATLGTLGITGIP